MLDSPHATFAENTLTQLHSRKTHTHTSSVHKKEERKVSIRNFLTCRRRPKSKFLVSRHSSDHYSCWLYCPISLSNCSKTLSSRNGVHVSSTSASESCTVKSDTGRLILCLGSRRIVSVTSYGFPGLPEFVWSSISHHRPRCRRVVCGFGVHHCALRGSSAGHGHAQTARWMCLAFELLV